MFGERERYGRRSVREEVEERVEWARAHWRRIVAAVVVVAVFGGLALMAQPVRPQDLEVGDCLFVRTPAAEDSGPGARPIGNADVVAATLLAGRATRAACDQSHGHEVSGLMDYPRERTHPGLGVQASRACRAAFEAYVGISAQVSIYEALLAAPSVDQWDAGMHKAICLVARKDGQWMDHPARGSEE